MPAACGCARACARRSKSNSGTNDPFAVFLVLLLVEMLLLGDQSWSHALITFLRDTVLGCLIGWAGGRVITLVLNRVALAQGLHAPFVAVGALVVFAFANAVHASGFLAVYLAGLVVGNRQTRAHNSVIAFLDAATWLAQIVMFVLLGLLVWPQRLAGSLLGSVAIALTLMLIARPAAVFLCLAPFNYQWRDKLFISWVGLRGAVGIFLASIPLLVGLPKAYLFFDVAFVVVLSSLLIQGWTVALAARRLHITFTRSDPIPRRVELDLPGQLAREIVGYPISAEQSLSAARPHSELGAADAGGAQRADSHPRRSGAGARRRLCLSAGAAGKGAGARPLLRAGCRRRLRPTRRCSATSSCRGPRRSARWPKSTACKSPPIITR